MAQKKAVQKKYELEATNFIKDWYRRQCVKVNSDDIFIIWFAFTKNGYKCMVGSYTNQNLFFELSANKRTGDIWCNCYERYEYIVKNGSDFYKNFQTTSQKHPRI